MRLTDEQIQELNNDARRTLMSALDFLVEMSEEDGAYVSHIVVCVSARLPGQDDKTASQNSWHTNFVPHWEAKGLMLDIIDRWNARWMGEQDDES
jgi:hypothetical protein